MLQEWRTAFNELQQDRRKLMIRLNGLTPHQLAFQPSPAAWSILQVLEHLVLTEQALIQGARKKLLQPARAVTPRESVMAFVVRCVMKSGMKVKTPAAAAHVIPATAVEFDAVRSQWSAARDDFEQFLEALPAERRGSALFWHPVSGGLTPTQALRFIYAHIHHHYPQIDRLVQLSSSPPVTANAA